MEQHVIELSDSKFNQATASGVVLVDFWAPWCGPCRTQGPILEDLVAELGGQATVAKVNVDQHPETARRFGVRGIPTLILLKDGRLVQQFVGVQSKPTLLDAMRTVLSHAASI